MAKEKFERTKIHVAAATLDHRLRCFGFSAVGAREIAQGRAPQSPADRQLLVEQFLRLARQTALGSLAPART